MFKSMGGSFSPVHQIGIVELCQNLKGCVALHDPSADKPPVGQERPVLEEEAQTLPPYLAPAKSVPGRQEGC